MKALSRVIAAALVLTAWGAFAGIADSPLPVLVAGQATHFLYSVPAVVDDGQLATFFSCTSTDTSTQQVGVEVFPFNGGGPNNDAAATSVSVAAGATVTFGTSSSTDWVVHVVGGSGSPSNFGSARILSTSTKLICTAFVADRSTSPPTTSWQLTIIAKLKQKAAN